jgi:hypothetical protein
MSEFAENRPLMIFVDETGVESPQRSAERMFAALQRIGVDSERVGLMPGAVRLDLWAMSPDEVRTALMALIASTGTNDGARS